jgi:hypothetical protein
MDSNNKVLQIIKMEINIRIKIMVQKILFPHMKKRKI